MPLGGCKLREALIHLWEPKHGLWGPGEGEAYVAGRHGCTCRVAWAGEWLFSAWCRVWRGEVEGAPGFGCSCPWVCGVAGEM